MCSVLIAHGLAFVGGSSKVTCLFFCFFRIKNSRFESRSTSKAMLRSISFLLQSSTTFLREKLLYQVQNGSGTEIRDQRDTTSRILSSVQAQIRKVYISLRVCASRQPNFFHMTMTGRDFGSESALSGAPIYPGHECWRLNAAPPHQQ